MELAALGGLAVLALIDSTSFGTLGVPVWMLVQPRVRIAAVLTYLGVIAGFYWLLGLVLLGGASALAGLSDDLATLADSPAFLWGQLAVGVGLFLLSFRFDKKRSAARRAARGGKPTRMEQLSQRAVGPDATFGTVATIALVAGVIEAASMLPYLAAVGIITTAGLGFAANAGLLAGYVVVMIVPALVLLGLRLSLHERIAPVLGKVNDWLQRSKDEMLAWVLGIIGFLVAVNAVQALGLIE
ncbi:Sap-like sulfolipid-1-addressing protein [Knoellia remsis]|uniref:Sap-like sulfolipid-1-addressing protein n=1 Tax=Knoellia remsis TaxID=407159 RepID=A0A2T0U886_9MICO|nr:GAP family protein [Knoellia remsis]PRY54124.1 Sap-like sulfolipid-1-addressing protein [Knoellia remsis]